MFTDAFYVRFLWRSRKEDLAECASRLGRFLESISALDRVFSTVYEAGKTSNASLVSPRQEKLEKMLAKGVNKKDIGKEDMPELGYSLTLWNPDTSEGAVTLRVHCGVYSKHVNNLCLINLPNSGAAVQRLLAVPFLVQLCKAVVEVWNPEHGVVSSMSCSKIAPTANFFAEVGWITYLSDRYDTIPKLPATIRVESVGADGRLVIATDEVLSPQNPGHVKTVRELASILRHESRL